MLIALLDRIAESGQTGADAVETYLNESVNLGNQLVLPLRGAPPLVDDAAANARERINAALERFLADGRADGTVCIDVNATDIIVCGAMLTQPSARVGQPFPAGRSAFSSTGSVRRPANRCPDRH